MPAARKPSESKVPRRPPATTLEARENQMIAYAVDLAERQLVEGTAPAQVTIHYLKLATTRERLEQEKLRRENALLEAKIQSIESQQRIEELYGKALSAMKSYSGQDPEEDDGYPD